MPNAALVIVDMQRDCGFTYSQTLAELIRASLIWNLVRLPVCCKGGYLDQQGYDLNPVIAIIPTVATLLAAFRSHNLPIYFTREGHRSDLSTVSKRELQRSRSNTSGLGIGDKGPLGRLLIRGEPGHDVIPELYPLDGEPVIDKPSKGVFAYTDFDLLLRLKGISNLVLCGVTTDVCVHTIMREANDRGYDCTLVKDACAATSPSLHAVAVDMIESEGGVFGSVSTASEIIESLKEFLVNP